MQIEIRCYGSIRAAVGARSIAREVEPETPVGGLLAVLDDEHGIFAHTDGQLVVMLDGAHVASEAADSTPLADGDVLALSSRAMPE